MLKGRGGGWRGLVRKRRRVPRIRPSIGVVRLVFVVAKFAVWLGEIFRRLFLFGNLYLYNCRYQTRAENSTGGRFLKHCRADCSSDRAAELFLRLRRLRGCLPAWSGSG